MNEKEIAKTLDEAAENAHTVPQMCEENDINLSQSYEIQHLSISRRLARGEKIVGYKLGFTSKAKMEQMGVHDLIWGILTDKMEIKNGGEVSRAKFIHPRAEPEIAFLVKKDFDKILTLEDCKDYLESTAAAVEVIDSRYENFKFSLEDVVADNCSSSGFSVGDWKEIPSNINDLNMQLDFNGLTEEKGKSNEILENPLQAVVELSRLTSDSQMEVLKGQIILAGAATKAVFVDAGIKVEAKVQDLGEVGFLMTK